MRIAIIGASDTAVLTAGLLGDRGHEVIIVEFDKERITEVSQELDCSFLQGDGARPEILEEVAPEQTDMLLCLTDNDKDNLVAGLMGRSLKFKHVVVSISDPEFENICHELGLERTIVPKRTISRLLADLAEGVDAIELTNVIRGEARLFTFTAGKEDEGTVADLELPDKARVICYYRKDEFQLADSDTRIRKGDEVVILTHSKHRKELEERWATDRPKEASEKDD